MYCFLLSYSPGWKRDLWMKAPPESLYFLDVSIDQQRRLADELRRLGLQVHEIGDVCA